MANVLHAQAPQLMNYQAVVRDHAGNTLPFGTNVTVRSTIHDLTATGTVVFVEVNTAVTNQFGLITQKIGGTSNLGVINWSSGSKYLQIEIDPTGGSNFTDMGTTQLLSVPYALYAGNAAAGATGPQGPPGNDGTVGPTGQQGALGPQGNAGPQGPTGLNGNNGSQGLVGPAGAQGPTGLQGSAGPQGIPGLDGGVGPTGATGAGVAGPSGAQGATGPSGSGPTGQQGPAGPAGPTGSQGPQGAQGLIGPQGNAGTQGQQGNAGAQGITGATGPQGSLGSQGPSGPQGPQGHAGPTGPTGLQGGIGVTGPTGAGTTGAQGPQGPQGLQGPQGAQGPAGTNGNGNIVTYHAVGNADQSTSSSGYSNLISLNLTPLNSTVYVHFTAGGTYTSDEEHNVWFALVVNGVTIKTFLVTGASLWNTWQGGFTYPVSVSTGSNNNISVQWATDGLASYTIYNYCATYPNGDHNLSLFVNDQP